MGQTTAETVREIEQTRGRLETEIRELESRLPSPARWTKRLIGIAVGGGTSGAIFWFVVRRIRGKAKAKKEARRAETVVQVLPERWAEALSENLEDGQWRQWAAIAGGAWLLIRLVELRQLRKMNRAIVVAPPPWGPTPA
jgi:hypothetical protein